MAIETGESRQYVTFGLGEELFGVEVTRAREILDLVPVTKVPQTPDYLLGVINLRGQVVPVVDLRVKLGLPKADATRDASLMASMAPSARPRRASARPRRRCREG